jgi:ferredoxin-NADP reductase
VEETKGPEPDNNGSHLYTSALLNRRWLSKKAFEIELTKPARFEFAPSQCLCFIHETIKRYYSLVSTPADATLRICLYHVENGIFSPLLATAKMGTHFKFSGPQGYFTFQTSQRPPVFVATGTGIAPFLSMGRSGVSGFTLLHEVKMPQELYYELNFINMTQGAQH